MLPDNKTLVMVGSSMTNPNEVYRTSIEQPQDAVNLSKANAALNLTKAEEMEWTGAANAKVHGFVVKPANFDASKKYPLARADSRRTAGRVEQ